MPSAAHQSSPRPPRASLREQLSLAKDRLMTALGAPRGFFVQCEYMESFRPVDAPYPEVEALCAAAPFRDVLSTIDQLKGVISQFGRNGSDPVLGRGMFPALDGMAAYAAVRRLKPKRIVEVGSGDSTYFLIRGVNDNGGGRVTCIDPQPRRELSGLDVEVNRRLLSRDDVDVASTLEPNDILFIDSSHIMLPGMDVDILFNRFFPRLRKGVVVHVHDVFLPDDYPPHWRHRNWSEQNALVGWIASGFFEILWPGRYVLTRHADLLASSAGAIAPLDGAGSIWLRRA